MICLQHLTRACSEQSKSASVLPINHVIQMPQCLSEFMNHDYSMDALKFGLVQYDIFYNGHIQLDSSKCLMMLTEAINKGSVFSCGSIHNSTGVFLISYFHLCQKSILCAMYVD